MVSRRTAGRSDRPPGGAGRAKRDRGGRGGPDNLGAVAGTRTVKQDGAAWKLDVYPPRRSGGTVQLNLKVTGRDTGRPRRGGDVQPAELRHQWPVLPAGRHPADRRRAGISGRAMADRLGVSQPTISRAKSGARLLALPLTRAWLDAVHADEPTRDTVLALAEASHSETVAYRLQKRTQAHLQDHVTNLEADTRRLCAVDSITVHGLLQIPEYAVSIMELADTEQMIDQTAALAARLERQQLLDDNSRSFSFVMLEQVLRAPMVTAAQLLHLAAVATRRPTVTIGIVPFEAPWPAIPWSGFNLYELRDSSRVVTALTHGEATVTGEEDLDLYARLHDRWRDRAVSGKEAAELCHRLARQLSSER